MLPEERPLLELAVSQVVHFLGGKEMLDLTGKLFPDDKGVNINRSHH